MKSIPDDTADGKATLVDQLLGAFGQQTMTWTSIDQDLRRHMASQGHNAFAWCPWQLGQFRYMCPVLVNMSYTDLVQFVISLVYNVIYENVLNIGLRNL